MDDVFRALADPSRRRLLDALNDRNGQTLRELSGLLDMARQSVTKHLALLEAAGLVTTVRRGRQKFHFLNAAPISEIAERWISHYDRPRVEALAALKHALEDAEMPNPEFVYRTYIRTTPERLWRALTEAAFTELYWGTRLESDWKVGSTITWHDHGVSVADPAQVVLEAEPYRRLSYTWHTCTPEWAAVHGIGDELREQLAREQRSTVSFDIEEQGPLVKLTVVHGNFEPGSIMVGMVSEGWPRLLSDLKTLLETGEAPQPVPTGTGSSTA